MVTDSPAAGGHHWSKAGWPARYLRIHTLLLGLSFTFYTLVSLGTLYLIGRSFLASGSPGLLLLECGVVLWSLAGTVGRLRLPRRREYRRYHLQYRHLAVGAVPSGGRHPNAEAAASAPREARVAGGGLRAALGALWLVTWAALSGWLPVFFIPGQGGTPVRYCVLISAIAMFVLSAGLLHAGQRAARLPFTSWYTLALLLLAVGLFGVMIQLSLWQRRELAEPRGAVAWRGLSALCRHRFAARVTAAASSAGKKVASGVLPGRHCRGAGARRGRYTSGLLFGRWECKPPS